MGLYLWALSAAASDGQVPVFDAATGRWNAAAAPATPLQAAYDAAPAIEVGATPGPMAWTVDGGDPISVPMLSLNSTGGTGVALQLAADNGVAELLFPNTISTALIQGANGSGSAGVGIRIETGQGASNNAGGAFAVVAGNGLGTGAGGGIILTGGFGGAGGGSNPGGSITLTAGNASGGNSAGGAMTMTAGAGFGTGNGGAASVKAGSGDDDGDGGNAVISAGNGGFVSGDGGDASITGGNDNSGAGAGGNVNLAPGTGNTDGGVFITVIKSGANQGAAGAAANELWRDTADNAIKIGV